MAVAPIIHVISDSLGDTGAAVVAAAISQFPKEPGILGRLSKVTNLEQVKVYLATHHDPACPMVVFHTIVNSKLRHELNKYTAENAIYAVDLIGPAIDALTQAFGERPIEEAGALHEIDKAYFKRIEATEYTVNHDDGRGEDDLSEADIVLIGVSRTSKTPLSFLLASRGYKVANIPLAPGVEPPKSLFEIDSRKIFGLTSSAPLLSEIRSKRLGKAAAVASSYSDTSKIHDELDEARALMRRLGCIVIRTDNKAIEETAQEILRYMQTGKGVEKLP